MSLVNRSSSPIATLFVALVVFPIVLLICVFSSCDVRNRSAKHACKAGDVQQCLEVARYYEAKSEGNGIINFAMSNPDTATVYYFHACKLESSVGCDGMMKMNENSNTARSTLELPAIVDVLINACVDQVDNSCKHLESLWSASEPWIANRSAIAFRQRCDAGNAQACYLVATMASKRQGSLRNTFDAVVPAFDKACAAHIKDACAQAQSYRDEQAKTPSTPPKPAAP